MVWHRLIIILISMPISACTSHITATSSASKRTTNPESDGSSPQDSAGDDSSTPDGKDTTTDDTDAATDGTDSAAEGGDDAPLNDGSEGDNSDDAGDDSADPPLPPPAPYIVLGGALTTVEESPTTIEATVADAPSGATITYSWTRTSNHPDIPASGHTSELQLTPPQAVAAYAIEYDLVVTVNGVALPTEAVVITVAADNDAPTANAGSDQTVDELAVVTLTAAASNDPEGETLSYAWSQTSGPAVTLSDSAAASPTFTAPDAFSNYALIFSLVVSDGTNSSAADSVTINVNADNDNLIPVRHRGYHARACGFDMNRNGVIGEPDDCRVCDGITTDPDQDGLDEDLWYIDATAGTDNGSCGSPAAPCRTIQYALNAADGPSVGQEDIFCIAGVFNESFSKILAGKATTYTRDGFEYPSNPVMIVGWDKNGNGIYPPHDPDDVAVLDGAGIGNHIFNAGSTSYLELAHLSARGISASGQWSAGFYHAYSVSMLPRTHLYFHDLDISDINANDSGGNMFLFGYNNSEVKHIALENNRAINFGTHFVLMASSAYDSNFVRITNNTLEPRGVPGNRHTMLHLDSISDVTLSYNVVNVKYADWTPEMTTFLNLGNCSKRVMTEHNDLFEITKALNAYLDPTSCAVPTTQDDITVRYNYMTTQASVQQTAITSGWRAPGTPDNQTFAYGNLTVLGNYIAKLPGNPSRDCIASSASNSDGPNPGTLKILGNTCIGLGITVGDSASQYSQHNVVVQNNIVSGLLSTQNNIAIRSGSGSAPSNIVIRNNIWDQTSSRWHWVSTTHATMGAWEAASGETNSHVCTPTFVDAPGLDFHLDPTDICAKNAGAAHPDLTVDQDGDAYPVTGIDIGADQI